MNPEYLPEPGDLTGHLAHVAEECAEVQKLCMKSIRFGIHDCHPNTPGVDNLAKMKEEIADLCGSIERLMTCEGELADAARRIAEMEK